MAASLGACQLFNEAPPEAPPSKVVTPPSDEPAPLPPEETPSPEAPDPAPASARPIEPGITSTGAPTRGTLPKATIDEKLQGAGPAIAACYERALKAKPGLRGTVDINFVVGPDGKVAHADVSQSEDMLDDAATVDCILDEIRKLVFPEPKGGRVFLNYPLKLEPPKP
jgi:outer membrane biosynthesis protein TonB